VMRDPRQAFRLARRADAGTRTPDPVITSDVLYQLSYVGASRRIARIRPGQP
jgi:hypothetical protein